MKRVCWLRWGILFLTLSLSWGQNPPPAQPAQLVMIFAEDPKEFKSLMLDKKPFASLEVGMEAATIWPLPPGKHELAITASGAEDVKAELSANSKEVKLALLEIGPNPDPFKKEKFPRLIGIRVIPLDLPVPDKQQARTYAYLLPGEQAIVGQVTHGNEEPSKVAIFPGKLVSLGTGKTAVCLEGKPISFVYPGSPGVYVSVILTGRGGKILSVPFSFEVTDPETPSATQEKPNGRPADY